ncbi:MAG: hypothetical protein AAF221_11500 [Pseudomonadota bacterium]
MTNHTKPKGAHLVGSIPFESAEDVFINVSNAMGDHIKRIPDGETGERSNWVDWQLPKLLANPMLQKVPNDAYDYTVANMVELCPGCSSTDITLGALGYADAALASFATFQTLQAEGRIPKHCRFQVSLPTPLAPTHLYVHPDLQADFEPKYEMEMLSELSAILSAIPHANLAIQWDTAVEFALLEGVMPTYIKDLEQGIKERLARLCAAVPDGVELGFHLCYGDSGHKHFCEPGDMTKLVGVANNICANAGRQIDWVHMPVPTDRDDAAYFAPLKDLNIQAKTMLYLGLVHYGDGKEGTQRRIAAAKPFARNFGVATECGFGRRPADTLGPLMDIHAAVSSPVA